MLPYATACVTQASRHHENLPGTTLARQVMVGHEGDHLVSIVFVVAFVADHEMVAFVADLTIWSPRRRQ